MTEQLQATVANDEAWMRGWEIAIRKQRAASQQRFPFVGSVRIIAGTLAILGLAGAVPAAGRSQVANTAAQAVPLRVGAIAPDSQLVAIDGKSRSLKEVLGGKPTLLIFYRGNWCPFCNLHLADLETVEAKIRNLGYQIVAITPDKPSEIVKTMDKHQLTYQLYSDSKAEAIQKFGVAFRVDDQTFATMRDSYHVNLEVSSGETHHILPVPSVFIIDRNGKIAYVHSNPDFKVRMKGTEVLAVAQQLAK